MLENILFISNSSLSNTGDQMGMWIPIIIAIIILAIAALVTAYIIKKKKANKALNSSEKTGKHSD